MNSSVRCTRLAALADSRMEGPLGGEGVVFIPGRSVLRARDANASISPQLVCVFAASAPHNKRMTRLRKALFISSALGSLVWVVAWVSYVLDPRPLGVPVRGVPRSAIASTFGAPRSGGRTHEGVDIFARRGTPVVAAHTGVVVHIGTFRLGGTVIHTLGRRGVMAYYAHLDRVREGLHVGELVGEGETIGFVGNTGNARTTPPHLHFEARPLALGFPARDPVPLLGGRPGVWRASHARMAGP